MRIEITRGVGIDGNLHRPGDVVAVDAATAAQLIRSGKAIEVIDEPEPQAETAPQPAKRKRQTATKRGSKRQTATKED